MFKKKAVQLTLVNDKQSDNEPPKGYFDDENDPLETILGGALILLGTYMAADTLRKCIIHTVATKVT